MSPRTMARSHVSAFRILVSPLSRMPGGLVAPLNTYLYAHRHFDRHHVSLHLVWCETGQGSSSAPGGSQIESIERPCTRGPRPIRVKSGETARGSLVHVRFGATRGLSIPTAGAAHPITTIFCRYVDEYDAPHRPGSTASCLNGQHGIGRVPVEHG